MLWIPSLSLSPASNFPVLLLFLEPLHSFVERRSDLTLHIYASSFPEMSNPHASWKSPVLEALPFLVGLLIATHVLALVYWIYRLATEKQSQRPQRSKTH